MNTQTEISGASNSATIISAIGGALIGAILTVFGQPYFTTILDRAKEPILASEVISTNIANLPDELRRQITVITTRYTIKHRSGGAAKKVTLNAESSVELPASTFQVQTTETYQIKKTGAKTFSIDVDEIRPQAEVVIEATHTPSATITWTGLAGRAIA